MRHALRHAIRPLILLLSLGFLLPTHHVHAQGDEVRFRMQERAAQQAAEAEAAANAARCCRCVKAQQTFCTPLTGVTACDLYRGSEAFTRLSQEQRNALVDFVCTDIDLSACRGGVTTPPSTTPSSPSSPTPAPPTPTSPATGPAVCARTYANFGQAVIELNPNLRPSTENPVPVFTSITPELGVQIPGLVFSPARKDGGLVFVPFIAQYISAVQRYAIGLAATAAIVMIVYGGFLYLLGSATQDIATGKQIIVDAILGLMLVFGAYTILNTINPNTLELPEIKLGFIEPSYYGEGEAAGEQIRVTSGDRCRCSPIPNGINENSVLKVPCYRQYDSAWGAERYGLNLLGGTRPDCPRGVTLDPDPNATACRSGAESVGSNACIGTLGQGACGPSALAVVLGYYGVQVDGHLITPLDTARYALRACLRQHNGGTSGICSPRFEIEYPNFTCSGQGGNDRAARAKAEIQAGHPVIFHCARCTVIKGDGNPGAGSVGAGHYMVLTGVNETGTLFSVHDVGHQGNSAAVAITSAELNGGRVGIYVVKPKANATAIPPAEQRCTGTSRSYHPGGNRQSLTYQTFTYCPRNECGRGWDANKAWMLFPTRLMSAQQTSIRLFLFLHGNNSDPEPEGDGHTRLLRSSLERANVGKDIVIIAPHYYGPGHMPRFNLRDFYTKAWAAVQAKIPHATLRDIVVGGHSGASCAGTLNQAVTGVGGTRPLLTPARGFIIYDGCPSDGDSRIYGGRTDPATNGQNFAPHGYSLLINPDAVGMGVDDDYTDPVTRRVPRDRGLQSRTSWGFSTAPERTCPPSVPVGGVECYRHPTENRSGSEWWEFITHVGHAQSVELMTDIAFRAFYGQ